MSPVPGTPRLGQRGWGCTGGQPVPRAARLPPPARLLWRRALFSAATGTERVPVPPSSLTFRTHPHAHTRQAAGPPWQELSRQFPWQYPMAGAGRGRGGPIPAAGWPCPHEAAAPWPPQRWLHPSPPPPLLPHRRRLGGCGWPDVGPDPANTAAGATLGLCRVWIRPRMGRSPWCRGIPFLHPVWKPRWDKGSDVLGHPQDVASASLPWLGPGGQDRALRGPALGVPPGGPQNRQ